MIAAPTMHVVIFDPTHIDDHATYQKPPQQLARSSFPFIVLEAQFCVTSRLTALIGGYWERRDTSGYYRHRLSD
jgi:hypothetical protein